MNYKPKYFSGKFSKKTPFARFKSKVYDEINEIRRLDFIGSAININAVYQENPCRIITASAHELVTGDRIYIRGVVGMTELNNRDFKITVTDTDMFTLDDTDSTDYTAYDSEGKIYKLESEAESEIQEVTLFNNGTATIYLAETEENATPELAGIVLKPNGSYDENPDNLCRFWVNKSVTGTVDLRIFTKRYGEGV